MISNNYGVPVKMKCGTCEHKQIIGDDLRRCAITGKRVRRDDVCTSHYKLSESYAKLNYLPKDKGRVRDAKMILSAYNEKIKRV